MQDVQKDQNLPDFGFGSSLKMNPVDEQTLKSFIGELREDFQAAWKDNARKLSLQVQEAVTRENKQIMESVSNQLNASTAMLKQTLEVQMQMQSDLRALQKRMVYYEQQQNLEQQLQCSKKQPKTSFYERMEPMEEPHNIDSDDVQCVESVFRPSRTCWSSSSSGESLGADLARGLLRVASPTSNKSPRISFADRSKRQKVQKASKKVNKSPSATTRKKVPSALRYKSEPTLSNLGMEDENLVNEASSIATKLQAHWMAPGQKKICLEPCDEPSPLYKHASTKDPTSLVREAWKCLEMDNLSGKFSESADFNNHPFTGISKRRSGRMLTYPVRKAKEAAAVEPESIQKVTIEVNRIVTRPSTSEATKQQHSAFRYKSEPGLSESGLTDQNQENSSPMTNLKADRNAPTWHKPTPLHVELRLSDPTKVVRATLNSQNLEVNTHSNEPESSDSNPQDLPDIVSLFAAIERDDIESCNFFLRNPDFHEINQLNDKSLTVLHKAALRGLPTVVWLILSHPKFTQANALMPGGLTALHCASFHGFREICDMLLSHPSFRIPFHKDDAGWTALDHAERFGGSAAGATAIALRRYGLRKARDASW